jgi:hypothetical protein
MDERLLNRTVQPTDANSNFSGILDRDLRYVCLYVSGSFPCCPTSNLIISGIPYALNTNGQFTAPVYAVFSWNHRDLARQAGDIGETIAVILS